ncbi:MAG: CBS domain-containing protein [Acidobacteriota bacterium]|jgi:CBS domain-containing protein|nr:CBS domain-containing protein [Acidobacteriota bacterium]
MGDPKVTTQADESKLREFTKAVLNDLQALEKMFEQKMFEDKPLRIGAEQEMFLVDSAMLPAPLALEVLEEANDKRLTTEIGLFDLEANLTPLDFTGDCLSKLENELYELIGKVKNSIKKFDGDVALVGILPTIEQSDLVIKNLTPFARYQELNRILTEMQGDDRIINIKGLDELTLHLQDIFTEFCNASFQVHLQVPISEFINCYNWSQAIAAPVLASAVNSPLFLGHRLWSETRIALFQHATDTRSPVHQARSMPTRVNFGDDWVKDSMLELFHEDLTRFRIILTRDIEEDSLEVLRNGGIPKLHAWGMHNGTVWRWNRACYGVMNGKPSLRVEARFLPSGPTILDEMANAAFFLGLMIALPKEYGDVTKKMSFDDAKENFFSVARYGLKSQIVWLDGQGYRAKRLILDELLPLAKNGLESVGVNNTDIEKYLGVIEKRAEAQRTGAGWMLESFDEMDENEKMNVRMRAVTYALIKNQESKKPVHKWELAAITEKTDWIDNYRTVERFMAKDLFTVRPEDVIDFAASLMNWKHIRHVPVEDDSGNLVGLISSRELLQILANDKLKNEAPIAVRDVMKTDITTISPETDSLEALKIMREKGIGCLPVVKDNKLIGIVTAHDFLTVSAKLFEESLKK